MKTSYGIVASPHSRFSYIIALLFEGFATNISRTMHNSHGLGSSIIIQISNKTIEFDLFF